MKRKDEADKVLENIQHRQNIEKIKFKVVDAFFSLLCAQKRIELTQQNYELAKLVYNRAESLYQQNRISKTDLLEVEVDLFKEKNAIQNRKALQDAQNNLKLIMRLNDSRNLIVAFSENDFPSFFQSFDKEKILEKVLRYNVDLVEKSENLSQQMIVQKQKSTMRPSVEIEVGGGVNSQFKNFTDAYKDKLESNLISLSISMPLYDGKISSYKLKMEKLRMELLNDKYRVSKDRYIQSMMSELSYISQLVGIISNQRKTLDLLKQEKMLVKQQVNMGRLNSDQYLRIKSSELKASNEYFVYIQEFYLLIFKYRYLALYDILRDKDL